MRILERSDTMSKENELEEMNAARGPSITHAIHRHEWRYRTDSVIVIVMYCMLLLILVAAAFTSPSTDSGFLQGLFGVIEKFRNIVVLTIMMAMLFPVMYATKPNQICIWCGELR